MNQTSSASLSSPPKQIGHRQWTAVETYKLKGLAQQNLALACSKGIHREDVSRHHLHHMVMAE